MRFRYVISKLRKRAVDIPAFGPMQAVYHLFRRGDARMSALLTLFSPRSVFQPFGVTGPDRYPEIFKLLHDAIGDGPQVAILSFGCSTGEEIFSLRRYFAQALLCGIDISPGRIEIARRLVPADQTERTRFTISSSTHSEPTASYDAILAMAVFRHGALTNGPPTSRGKIDFSRFASATADLARSVKPGGLLAIRHANFRFMDTPAAAAFDIVFSDDNITPNYDRDGDKLPHLALEACVFRKRAG